MSLHALSALAPTQTWMVLARSLLVLLLYEPNAVKVAHLDALALCGRGEVVPHVDIQSPHVGP